MGIALDVYYIYELHTQNCENQVVCFTALRPAYNNAIQNEEDDAETQLELNRDQRLEEIISALNSCGDVLKTELLGCSYELPIGEKLYESHHDHLDIWVAEQKYGSPWIILGTAESEMAFWQAVAEDSDLVACEPKSSARKLTVSFWG